MEKGNINSRVFSHLLGDNCKLVLEAYIATSFNQNNIFDPSHIQRGERIRGNCSFSKSTNLLEDFINAKGNVLYIKPRREIRNFIYKLFSSTAVKFANVSNIIKIRFRQCFIQYFITRNDGSSLVHDYKQPLFRKKTRKKANSEESTESSEDLEMGFSNSNRVRYHGTRPIARTASASYDHENFKDNGNNVDSLVTKFFTEQNSYGKIVGPVQLDEAAWIAFRIGITKKLVHDLKFKPYVHIREGLFCTSAEVLRSTSKKVIQSNILVKVTVCDESLDTFDAILRMCCDIIYSADLIARVRCFVAKDGSDLIAVEYNYSSKDDADIFCKCDGLKLKKVKSGFDFDIWTKHETSQLCTQCNIVHIEKYQDFQRAVGKLITTASPSHHEKDMKGSDFILADAAEDSSKPRILDEDLDEIYSLLSRMDGINHVYTLSLWRTNSLMFLLLLLLFLPIIIIAITPARNQAEIIAAGVAFVPGMMTALIALVTISPETFLSRLSRTFMYRKVVTFQEIKSILNLESHSDEKWRKVLMHLKSRTYNLGRAGGIYNLYDDPNCFPLGQWCYMTLKELQKLIVENESEFAMISNEMKKVVLQDKESGTVIPLIGRGQYVYMQRDAGIRSVKVEDLAHEGNHENCVIRDEQW